MKAIAPRRRGARDVECGEAGLARVRMDAAVDPQRAGVCATDREPTIPRGIVNERARVAARGARRVERGERRAVRPRAHRTERGRRVQGSIGGGCATTEVEQRTFGGVHPSSGRRKVAARREARPRERGEIEAIGIGRGRELPGLKHEAPVEIDRAVLPDPPREVLAGRRGLGVRGVPLGERGHRERFDRDGDAELARGAGRREGGAARLVARADDDPLSVAPRGDAAARGHGGELGGQRGIQGDLGAAARRKGDGVEARACARRRRRRRRGAARREKDQREKGQTHASTLRRAAPSRRLSHAARREIKSSEGAKVA